MLLAGHIIVAILGLLATTILYIHPKNSRFKYSYILTSLTLVSGSLLVFISGASLPHTCMSGLVYLSINSMGIYAAKRKLAIENIHK